MTIDVRAQWADAMDPSFRTIMNTWDVETPKFYDKCSTAITMDSQYFKDSYTAPMPTMPKLSDVGVAEGSAPDKHRLTQRIDSTHSTEEYGMIAEVSHQLQRDDMSSSRVIAKIPTALSQSGRDAKEVTVANHYIRGDSGSYLGPDSVALLSESHPTRYYDGNASAYTTSTVSNTPGSATLSESTLDDALVAMRTFTDEAGKKQVQRPVKLIIPSKLVSTAKRLLMTPKLPGSAENDINPNKGAVSIQENIYITDVNCWFLVTATNPIFMAKREELNLRTTLAVDGSRNVIFGAYQSYISDWSYFLGLYGSMG